MKGPQDNILMEHCLSICRNSTLMESLWVNRFVEREFMSILFYFHDGDFRVLYLY